MAFSYGFFNAQLTSDGDYDRVYTAENFAEYFHLFVGNGVFADPSTSLQVISSLPASMNVMVSAGYGWINGYYAKNTDEYPLNISVAHASLPRYDAVVLRWVNETRSMELAVLTGLAAASPVIPSITRNTEVYEIMLAAIRVEAGATNITQSAITDKRPDNTVCGWVTSLIDQIDTTNLFAQYNTAFTEWFDNVKAQLEGNVATNLQNQIDQLVTKTNELGSEVIPLTRGGTGKTSAPLSLYALINGATALTNTGLATGDYVGIGDISAATGKKVTLTNLATYLNSSMGLSKIQVGSYTGTGTYGSANPNSITCSFAPKFIWLYLIKEPQELVDSRSGTANSPPRTRIYTSQLTTGYIQGQGFCSTPYTYRSSYAKKSSDGKTVYWYVEYGTQNVAAIQFNTSDNTYYWLAIG